MSSFKYRPDFKTVKDMLDSALLGCVSGAQVYVTPDSRGPLLGFEILRPGFVFARILRWLRRIDPDLARWPVGARQRILCRNPSAAH